MIKNKLIATIILLLTGATQIGFSQNIEEIIINQEPYQDLIIGDLENWPSSPLFSMSDSIAPEPPTPVRIAVVLSDIGDKKDLEFARGILMGLENVKNEERTISLTMLNGAVPQDSVTMQIDDFSPNLIIVNFEKNFPAYLNDYAKDNGVMMMNAFDMRNDSYRTNPNIVQLLTPSVYFNEEIADFFGKQFSGYELIIVGEMDKNDQIFDRLSSKLVNGVTALTDKEAVEAFQPEASKSYLFYCFPTKKDDVKTMVEALAALRKKYPGTFSAVVGRPSWITFTDLAKNFDAANVYIPSRCYFDPASVEGKKFITDYNSLFGHPPVKTFPVYSVMGYDIINHFTKGIAESHNDYSVEWPKTETLQTDFSFRTSPEISGYYNPEVYVIRFNANGSADKINVD